MTDDKKPVGVKRYDLRYTSNKDPFVECTPRGEWVRYEDHERLMRIARESMKFAIASYQSDGSIMLPQWYLDMRYALAALGEEQS